MLSGGCLLAPGSQGRAGRGGGHHRASSRAASAAGSPRACLAGESGADPRPAGPSPLANPPKYLLGRRGGLAGVGQPLPSCKPCQAFRCFPFTSWADPRSQTGAKMGEKILQHGQNPESHIPGRPGDPGAFPCFQREAVLPGSGQNHLPPAVPWGLCPRTGPGSSPCPPRRVPRGREWQNLAAQNSPRLPEQCQETALWGWVGLVSIISVSSLDFGNRVVVVLQEIL